MALNTIPKEYRSVAIVGGTGELGKYIVREFLKHQQVNIRIITRKGSNNKDGLLSEYKSNNAAIYPVDYNNIDNLNEAFKGIDVVISTIGSEGLSTIQSNLIKAAVSSKIKLFIPSEFGSEVEGKTNPLFLQKIEIRNQIKESGLNYIYYTNGFFIQHIITDFYGIDIKNSKAQIVGKGDTQFTVTSLNDVAKFVYQTYYLSVFKNTTVNIVGENTTINKILKDITKVTGKKFKATHISLAEVQKVLDNPNIDFFGKISYYLRKDIELGDIKLPSNHNDLVNFKSTSVLDVVKTNYAKVSSCSNTLSTFCTSLKSNKLLNFFK
ncbi:NAD(P)-binding protein [Neoconidiobolus thromboides FSU 785]|nr:NAD(P)-binding protein [Neoconidiobolus thromboides FSU 785]KAI9297083.1 NAD(P)-binding protein [Neoconidiobolus thromboides FSU 785]